MTRTLPKPIDDALFEALRDYCGPDKAVGAVEVVVSVLERYSLRSGRAAGFFLIPAEEKAS